MNGWVVIDIGCHECGVGSVLAGVYASESDARLAVEKRDAETLGWRDGGSTSAEAFDLSAVSS